jgi:hypothetical protein
MRLSICLAALLPGAAPALAGSLKDGRAAYKAREFDKAAQLLKPLAEKGNADAQELFDRAKRLRKEMSSACRPTRSNAPPAPGKRIESRSSVHRTARILRADTRL